MEKTTAKQTGVLNLFGSRYAVLSPASINAPMKPYQAGELKVENKIPYLFVAKEFFVEREHEGILMGETVFLAPHWISIAGDFVVEWLPETVMIELLLPSAGEVVE